MEGRPERLADYFLVVGLGRNVTRFELFPTEEVDFPSPSTDPITDIAVVFKKHESCPKGYHCIERTPGGHVANLNTGALFSGAIHLCFSREKDRAPITEISVLYTSTKQPHPPPPGHETLAFSVGGRPADLNKGGVPTYITFKRGILYGHNTAITGLCLIMPGKGEEPPPGYKMLQMDLNRGHMTPAIFLCYKTSQVRPPSVAYTPEIISRFPVRDYPEFSLPESIPLFCLPCGVSVEHWDRRSQFPLPTFSTFALTNEKGQCMYGAVVAFYEQIPENETTSDMRAALEVGAEEVLHMNKCICLLSHWPFFSAFRAFLSFLYRLSVSRNSIPLERYIGNLMTDAPFPTMERPHVQLFVGSEQIVFSLPVQTPLPMSVSTHWSLLATLDPDTLLTLHSLLLMEQKLVLHSSRPALLTSVGEALRSTLFPFKWQCTYIPMCPLAFSNYMQAPVPFIIGVDSQYFDVFEKPSDVSTVDLDTSTLTLCAEAEQLLNHKPLPSKPLKVLRQELKDLAVKVTALNPGIGFAVEVAPIESEDTYKADLERVDVKIRETFLRFHAIIIGGYRMCLRPLLSAPSERSHDAKLLFDQKLFLQHCPAAERSFFHHLFDTQLFCVFVEQCSFVHAESTALAFFDECTEKLKANPLAQLLDVEADVSRRSDLPTVVAIPPDTSGLAPDRTYTYPVFPSLNSTLFSAGGGTRMNRSPSVCSLHPGSPIVGRRTRAEKHRDKLALEQAHKNDPLWSKAFLSHICSLWYVLLPAHLGTHWNKMGVLSQALELLEDMRKANILPNDEVCYRILMEQCVKLHRPALAVKVYNEMSKAGIQPNAITYGFYNKVVMEGSWPSTKRNWKILRIVVLACFYLLSQLRREEVLDESIGVPDFRVLARTTSLSSRKSLSALDVGVDEEEEEEEPLISLKSQNLSSTSIHHKGSVYRLSTSVLTGAGDYVVRGNSSYMADKSPHWSADKMSQPLPSSFSSSFSVARGLWTSTRYGASQGSPTVRRLSRVDQPAPSSAPGLHLELTSCSQCPSCHRLLYDEVIMANWSESEADYKTQCPYCHFRLVANLTIIKKQMLNSAQNKESPITEEEEDVVEREGKDTLSSLPPPEQTGLENRTKSLDRTQLNRRSPERVQAIRSEHMSQRRMNSLDSVVGGARHVTNPQIKPTSSTAEGATGAVDEKAQEMVPGRAAGEEEEEEEQEGGGERRLSNSDGLVGLEEKRGKRPPLPPGSRERRGRRGRGGGGGGGGGGGSGREIAGVQSPVVIAVEGAGQPVEQTDVGGIRNYIAQMRARGHKRASSAPVHYQPPAAPSLGQPTGEGGKRERGKTRRGKIETEYSPPLVVPYLSPIVLRKEVETLITQDGSKVLENEELVTNSPTIYWNLVWYFSRLQLPTYLPLLTLWGYTRSNRELRQQYVQMKVDLLWDKQFPGVHNPLYLMWLGRVPRVLKFPPNPHLTRRDSESQLQSLVARAQCGDLLHVLTCLFQDRQQSQLKGHCRSVYREILFLKSATFGGSIDVDQFDQEFRQATQRLPKDLASLLGPDDHPPTSRALFCRRNFSPLQVT